MGWRLSVRPVRHHMRECRMFRALIVHGADVQAWHLCKEQNEPDTGQQRENRPRGRESHSRQSYLGNSRIAIDLRRCKVVCKRRAPVTR